MFGNLKPMSKFSKFCGQALVMHGFESIPIYATVERYDNMVPGGPPRHYAVRRGRLALQGLVEQRTVIRARRGTTC